MKRYLLFGGSNYYPEGGWRDFCGDFDSIPEAIARENALVASIHSCDEWWSHLIDTVSSTIVKTGSDHAPMS